jgi:arylsulfatase A-like enzyme
MSTPLNRREFLACAGASALPAQTSKRPPNFVILFADDMGYGDLACYGHPTIRTPNLDQIAADGIRFTSWYAAASVCTPSRAGLLTGRYPLRAGQPNNTGPDTVGGLPLGEILLPQVLKQRGYRTMAIGKWHLGYKPKEYLPTSRGFDSWFGLPYSNDMIPPWVKTQQPLHLYRDTEIVEEMRDQSTLTERYTAGAVKFIESSARNPFFLYLPYAMPHLPISASARFRGRSRAGLYGDVIETLDWSAGEILGALKRQGVDSDTLVIFTSDNGPWLNLPDRMLQKGNEPWHTGFKSLLRGAKGGTYEGGFRVCSIARWPGVIPRGQTSAEMASSLDLFPTLAKAAQAEMPSDRVYDGHDILPLLRGSAKSPRHEFFYFRARQLDAVREGSWKLRLAREGRTDLKPDDPLTPELFNVDDDPAEQYNRYAQNRPLGERLLERLRAFGAELKANLAT